MLDDSVKWNGWTKIKKMIDDQRPGDRFPRSSTFRGQGLLFTAAAPQYISYYKACVRACVSVCVGKEIFSGVATGTECFRIFMPHLHTSVMYSLC